MFKQIEITLYDFFGYLLPGAIILGAIFISFWTLFWPGVPLAVHTTLTTSATVFILFTFYLLGHLGQAIGNLMERLRPVKALRERTLRLSPELRKKLLEAVSARFGLEAKSLPSDELFSLCDQTLVHHCSLGERDIFVYREGFYRGVCIALSLLCVSTILRLIRTPVLIVFGPATLGVHRPELALCALLMAVGTWLAFERYLRFGRHKCQSCFLRFLALVTQARHDDEQARTDSI
jgi:hypothetical protein